MGWGWTKTYLWERREWRIVESARRERAKEKRAVVTNRKLWVEGRKWYWDEGRMCWVKGKERARGEGGAEGGRRTEMERGGA